jgi:hypothetical protein
VVGGGAGYNARALVPRRRHDSDSFVERVVERILEPDDLAADFPVGIGRAAAPEAEAHVDDVPAVVHRVVDGFDQVGGGTVAGEVEDLDGHEVGAMGHPGPAVRVAGRLEDGPRDVRAVAVVVVGVELPSRKFQGVTMVTPRGPGWREAPRSPEDGSARIRLVGDAGVDNGDGDTRAGRGRELPGAVGPHAAGGVVEVPLVVVVRVVRGVESGDHVVHPGELDNTACLERAEGGREVDAGGDLNHIELRAGVFLRNGGTEVADGLAGLAGRNTIAEADDDAVGVGLVVLGGCDGATGGRV